jgi:hypothetical protein
MLGIPSAITAAAQAGLNPGALGFSGLPCIVTKEPTNATGNPAGPTLTVSAPSAITPGGGGKPMTLAGIPTLAIGTGI